MLSQAKALIKENKYNNALEILKKLDGSLASSDIDEHQSLMRIIVDDYQSLKKLQDSNRHSLEATSYFIKFGMFKEAEEILVNQWNLYKPNFIELINEFEVNIQAKIFNILGHYFYTKDSSEAIFCFENEIKISSSDLNPFLAIAELSFRQGELKKAIYYIRHALQIEPSNTKVFNNLMMMLHYDIDVGLEELSKEASNFETNGSPFLNCKKKLDLKKNKSKLRVGFVSGDFRKHALFFWLKDFLKDQNFKNLELFLYQNGIEDSASQYYQQNINNWRNVVKLSDEELSFLIKQDEIDILIDLSGHTSLNRLGVFVHRSAPIQISWLGQSGPLGVSAMDYMLTGKNQVKEIEETFYSEEILRLPSFLAPYSYEESSAHKNIKRSIPYFEKGYITFLSANNQIKINENVLNAWVCILKQVENSILILKNKAMDDPSTRNKLIKFFSKQGIEQNRIQCFGFSLRDQYLDSFNQADLVLDSFPIGGSTTSLDILSMGVPILTLCGKHCAHRVGYSLNKILGLDDLISYDINEYIQKAIDLAFNPGLIQNYRNEILDNFLKSDICNLNKFANDFEKLLFDTWAKH